MFDKINLTTTTAKSRLSSRHVTEETLSNKSYVRENLLNSRFSISGSADCFTLPPISDFALQSLFHLEAFSVFHYDYGSFTERQNYHSFLILYTYSGKGTLEYHNRTYTMEEGDGFFINCMDYHKYQVDGNHWDTAVLHLNGPLLPDFHMQCIRNGYIAFHEPITGQYQNLLEQLLTLYSTPSPHRDWQASACINNILIHLLNLYSEETSRHTDFPENIAYLIRYMEHNYTSNLSLDFLADFCSINKYHLSREFKKYTGFSPNDYLITLRINQAKNLLQNTSLPASKIAHEVGIHNINNFMNLFKKKIGMTPIQFRKNPGTILNV